MLKNVIDFQISSDPKLGALSKSADGSTFSIRLDENGLGIPKKSAIGYIRSTWSRNVVQYQ